MRPLSAGLTEAQQREQIINSDPRVQAAERYVREQEAALMAQKRPFLEIKQAFPAGDRD